MIFPAPSETMNAMYNEEDSHTRVYDTKNSDQLSVAGDVELNVTRDQSIESTSTMTEANRITLHLEDFDMKYFENAESTLADEIFKNYPSACAFLVLIGLAFPSKDMNNRNIYVYNSKVLWVVLLRLLWFYTVAIKIVYVISERGTVFRIATPSFPKFDLLLYFVTDFEVVLLGLSMFLMYRRLHQGCSLLDAKNFNDAIPTARKYLFLSFLGPLSTSIIHAIMTPEKPYEFLVNFIGVICSSFGYAGAAVFFHADASTCMCLLRHLFDAAKARPSKLTYNTFNITRSYVLRRVEAGNVMNAICIALALLEVIFLVVFTYVAGEQVVKWESQILFFLLLLSVFFRAPLYLLWVLPSIVRANELAEQFMILLSDLDTLAIDHESLRVYLSALQVNIEFKVAGYKLTKNELYTRGGALAVSFATGVLKYFLFPGM